MGFDSFHEIASAAEYLVSSPRRVNDLVELASQFIAYAVEKSSLPVEDVIRLTGLLDVLADDRQPDEILEMTSLLNTYISHAVRNRATSSIELKLISSFMKITAQNILSRE